MLDDRDHHNLGSDCPLSSTMSIWYLYIYKFMILLYYGITAKDKIPISCNPYPSFYLPSSSFIISVKNWGSFDLPSFLITVEQILNFISEY